MRLHEILDVHIRHRRKRLGRGNAAGSGTTAGRGTKGQKARTGANSNIPRTFVGGATSYMQRLPKLKGFTSRASKSITVSMDRIAQQFPDGTEINLVGLVEKGIISPREAGLGIKIVGGSKTISKKFTFSTDSEKMQVSKKQLA